MMELLLFMVKLTVWGLLDAWPVTALVVSAVVVALAYNSPLTEKGFDRSHLLVLLPSALTIIIVLSSAFRWSTILVLLMVLAHVPMITFPT